MKTEELEAKWDEIVNIIESSKDHNYTHTLIVTLEDWNPSVLSPKRKQLLELIRKGNVESESQLARMVHRNRPNVVADLKLLEHYGLVKLVKEGKRMVPKPEKTRIVII